MFGERKGVIHNSGLCSGGGAAAIVM